MIQQVSLLLVFVAAVRTVESETLVVDLLQVVVEIDFVCILFAAAVTHEFLQALVDNLNNEAIKDDQFFLNRPIAASFLFIFRPFLITISTI